MARIVRMDDWDRAERKIVAIRRCDMHFRPVLHRKGGMYYITMYRRSSSGMSFSEIKESVKCAESVCEELSRFLGLLVGCLDGWAIVTTPARRHYGGFHFATAVCRKLAETEKINFYEGAVQCVDRNRMEPEFHLLRPLAEKRIIIFDDIITTGKTLEATYALIREKREQVICIVGINNK